MVRRDRAAILASPRSFGVALLVHALTIALLAQGAVHVHSSPQPPGVVRLALDAVPHADDALRDAAETRPIAEFPETEVHKVQPVERIETPLLVELPPLPPEPEPPEEVNPQIESLPSPPPRRSGRFLPRASPVHPGEEEAPTVQEARPAPAPAGGDNQEISPDQPPRIIDPQWPRSVRRRFTGSIVVDVKLTADGRAADVEIIEGTGNAEYDAALRETFADSRYIPASAGGVPVACTHRFRVTFRRE